MDYRTEVTRVLMRVVSYRTNMFWLVTEELIQARMMYSYDRNDGTLVKKPMLAYWEADEFRDSLEYLREDEQWVILAILFGD